MKQRDYEKYDDEKLTKDDYYVLALGFILGGILAVVIYSIWLRLGN